MRIPASLFCSSSVSDCKAAVTGFLFCRVRGRTVGGEHVFGILVPVSVVQPGQRSFAFLETVEILIVVRPAHFGQRRQARQQHVFGMVEFADEFGPPGCPVRPGCTAVRRRSALRTGRASTLSRSEDVRRSISVRFRSCRSGSNPDSSASSGP